jgi:hypothetical protein
MEPSILDLGKFQLPPGMTAKHKSKPPRTWKGQFLRGPVPWNWIKEAMKLPGQALAVGLVLWREAGCQNAMTIRLTPTRLQESGISHQAGRRGVRALEGAGLITIQRKPGRALEVTILLLTERTGMTRKLPAGSF